MQVYLEDTWRETPHISEILSRKQLNILGDNGLYRESFAGIGPYFDIPYKFHRPLRQIFHAGQLTD